MGRLDGVDGDPGPGLERFRVLDMQHELEPIRGEHPYQERRPNPLRHDARDNQYPRGLRRGHGVEPKRDRVPDLAHVHEAEDPAVSNNQQVHIATAVRERIDAVLRLPDRHRGFVLGRVLNRKEGHGDGLALVPDQHEAAEIVPGLGRAGAGVVVLVAHPLHGRVRTRL